jgi:hypothetical protein
VADEGDVTAQLQGVANLQQVLGVALEQSIAAGIERAGVGAAATHVVEQHLPVVRGKCWCELAPHLLAAAETMAVD